MNSRRYDLDWLRVIAFLVLIYFHTAIFFIPGGLPMIQNVQTSAVLEIFVNISSQFRLALLFLISGAGVAFAKKRTSNKAFIKARSQRLLIPLLAGIILVVPPMVFTEKLFLGEFIGDLVSFYPQFFTEGVYPEGNLSWHHFWFIAYLYLFCVLGLKSFRSIDENRWAWLNYALAKVQVRPMAIYGFVIILLLPELLLRALFPGFRDLIHDGASFTHWFLMFLAGYTMARNSRLLDVAEQLRYQSLAIVCIITTALFLVFGDTDFKVARTDPMLIEKYILWCVMRMLMVWSALLTCLGFAARHLKFNNRLLSYLNAAVYPLFIFHLTIITVLGYWIVPLYLPIWIKYLLITQLTILIVLIIYQWLIRPFDIMRLLFGVKAKNHN